VKWGYSLSGARPAGEAVELAREAERLGIDEVWVTEDYFERGAFALAGALAAATERVRIGIGVVNPWTRHPVLTAMETAALAEIAPGRVLLGLGASNARWMQDQLGIPFEHPVPRLAEALDIVRAALDGRPVRHDGDGWRVDAQLGYREGASAIPLVVGAKGPLALRAAASRCDGALLSVLSAPAYVAWVRDLVGPSLRLWSYVTVHLDPDRDRARAAARPLVARYLGVHGEHLITRIAGMEPERAQAFRAGWVSGTPRTDLVTDADLDRYCAAGDDDDVRRHLAAQATAGLDVAVLRDTGGPDAAAELGAVLALAAGRASRSS
jgi:5,10-methylenetetrahydromethanopterin reductase